jgi:hypothetical protein
MNICFITILPILNSITMPGSALITKVIVVFLDHNASLPPDQGQHDRQQAPGGQSRLPDPNVSRPKMTDVTYLLGQKSRTL